MVSHPTCGHAVVRPSPLLVTRVDRRADGSSNRGTGWLFWESPGVAEPNPVTAVSAR